MTGEEGSTRVAKPGFSEHETGYAFDLTETETGDYQGTGDYAWINENCYKFGFIERYKEEKTDLTKIQPEPWHFRYVGIPHAYYMTMNNLCLEEYINMLSQFVYGEHHLEFTDENGKGYEIYFIPADMASETTNVPVPSGKKYDISGNNIDGFIVTLYKKGEDYIPEGEEEEAPRPGYTAGGETADAETAEDGENAEEPSSEAEAEQAEVQEEAPAEETAE
jgi:D-alanyl-D-alanine carboxypeptidase